MLSSLKSCVAFIISVKLLVEYVSKTLAGMSQHTDLFASFGSILGEI